MEDTNLQGGIKEKNGVCNNTIAAATSKGSSKVGIVILRKNKLTSTIKGLQRQLVHRPSLALLEAPLSGS